MTRAKLETALSRRGLNFNTVTFKRVYREQLPSATFLGFYNGFELWLGVKANIVYKVV